MKSFKKESENNFIIFSSSIDFELRDDMKNFNKSNTCLRGWWRDKQMEYQFIGWFMTLFGNFQNFFFAMWRGKRKRNEGKDENGEWKM